MNKQVEATGSTTGKLIENAGNIIDKLVITEAVRQKAREELAKEINRNFEAPEAINSEYYKTQTTEAANARQRETETNKSDHASWLSRNITPMLAILVILLTFTLYGWIMFGGEYLKERENVIFSVLGSLTTMAAGITNYYFGSSMGAAKQKEALIQSMNKKSGI